MRQGKKLSKITPVFTTRQGVLYHTDSKVLFSALRDASVDCVFADPPFNLKKNYGRLFNDLLSQEEYLQWSFRWLDEACRVLKRGGALFVYILPRWGFYLAHYLESEKKMTFRHWIALSMKSTFRRGRKLYPAHYAILYFTKGDPKIFSLPRVQVPRCRKCKEYTKDYGGYLKKLNKKGLSLSDFWEDTSPARHHKFKSRWHINELRPEIPFRCIQMSTRRGSVVLDPFGGGGSTYEVAERLGRYWVGTELVDCSPIIGRFKRLFNEEHLYQKPDLRLLKLYKKPTPDFLINA